MKTFKELSIEYKDLLEVSMSKANRDVNAKKMAKKVAIAKSRKKCSGNMTPSVQKNGSNVKVTCTPKDKTRARKMKLAHKRIKPAEKRKRAIKSTATKTFRR